LSASIIIKYQKIIKSYISVSIYKVFLFLFFYTFYIAWFWYSDNLNLLKDDLICSFLNAINLFINEVNEGANEELQEINFRGTRILYEREGRLLAIAITKKTNLQIERGILREIVEDFYIRFKHQINNFNGEVYPGILDYKKRLKSMNLNSLFKFDIHI
jgi:hypothetical protein